jgi:hypothetical protein
MFACSTTSKLENEYLNKKAPGRGKSLEKMGTHNWEQKDYTLAYVYEIDNSANTINLKHGTLIFDQKRLEEKLQGKVEWYRFKSLTLYFLFLDKDGIIRSVEKAEVKGYSKSLADVIPIEVSVPYNLEFTEVFVFPGYYVEAWL